MESLPLTIKGKAKAKRNVWSSQEIRYFLQLVQEKHVLGLMDGKRLRVSDIFKTLVAPMKEMGYIRDPSQLAIKFKNLKAEYYKCKRHNNISGNEPYEFEFFNELDEILRDRPMTQSHDVSKSFGFESVSNEVSTEFLILSDEELSIEADTGMYDYDNAPQADGAIPGCSNEVTESVSKDLHSTTKNINPGKGKRSTTPKAAKEDNFIKGIEKIIQTEGEKNREMMNQMLERQEQILLNCTSQFMKGLKDILK